MNYTTNYSLPQWEATDRITRGSVNGAMSTIDSAIAAGASPWVKVASAALAANATELALSVPANALSQYAVLLLAPEVRSSSDASTLGLYYNGLTSGYKMSGYSSSGAGSVGNLNGAKVYQTLNWIVPAGSYLFTVSWLIGPTGTIEQLASSMEVSALGSGGLQTVSVISGGAYQLLSGSRVTIYGLKR